MKIQPPPMETFQVYHLGADHGIPPAVIAAASPYEAALALEEGGEGDIVVLSPNGMQSRFGYRSPGKLVHLDD